MKAIHKFILPITDTVELDMPAGAQVLSVAEQSGEPVLWAIVDTEEPKTKRRFHIYGTGHPLAFLEPGTMAYLLSWRYIGTFQLTTLRGRSVPTAFVGHVFEVG